MNNQIKQLPAIPDRIASLPKDARGYPIPWNVLIGKDGTPIFTVNDNQKHVRALREMLCPICGQPNDEIVWFVGGPLSAFHPRGVYNDLPGHEECIEFALQVCPYLAAPNYKHRIDIVNPDNVPDSVVATIDLTQEPNRPDLFVMVASRKVVVLPHELGVYVKPEKPIEYRYWQNGRRLSSDEGERLAVPFRL